MASKYTKLQQESIKQCLLDADIMGLSVDESIAYIRSRIGIEFSVKSHQKYRELYLNDESNVQWISYYARQGFVEFYRKRISEMEMIQKNTLQQWLIETNRPDAQKDKNLILKLVAELRANNQHLTSLGMVTPIIATIKNLIDRDKVADASKFVYPIEYTVRREDTDTIRTKDTNRRIDNNDNDGSTIINNMVPRELDDPEETC